MPCDCLDPDDFVCTGNGADLLPNPSLTWLLTTDGLIGTPPTESAIPNGNINQLFWKLLQNDCSIANFIQNSFIRTYASVSGSSPSEGTVPAPLVGAPLEPGSGQLHTVFYNDFEVLYRYSATAEEWEEVNRTVRLLSVTTTYEATVTVPLEEGDTEGTFTIPTETDDGVLFAFEMKDLSLIYVNNMDEAAPIVGVVPGLNVAAPIVRLALSAAIPAESSYELVAVFRRTVVS